MDALHDEDKHQRVLAALKQITASGANPSLSAVARRAQVDRGFIYRHPELREAVTGHTASHAPAAGDHTVKPASSTGSSEPVGAPAKKRASRAVRAPQGLLLQLEDRIRAAEKAEWELELELSKLRSQLTSLRKARVSLNALPPDVLAVLGASTLGELVMPALPTASAAENGTEPECGPDISTWTKIDVSADDILEVMQRSPYATWTAQAVSDWIPGSSPAQIRRRLQPMLNEQNLINATSQRGRFTLAHPPADQNIELGARAQHPPL